MPKRSERETLLLFGGVPREYVETWEITSDLTYASERLGVRFKTVPQARLRARFDAPTSAEEARVVRLVADLLEGTQQYGAPMPSLTEVARSARLYVVMDALRADCDGDSVTIVCRSWIKDPSLPVPCIALGLFQEQGVPAACQGDLDALMTMVLYRRAGVDQTFMGGARPLDGNLLLSHCALSRTLLGREQEYAMHGYHGWKGSPTLRVSAPRGQVVTLARLTRDLETLLLTTGTLKGQAEDAATCTNALVLEVDQRDQVLDAVRGPQQHYVMARGDHRTALAAAASAHDIPVRCLM